MKSLLNSKLNLKVIAIGVIILLASVLGYQFVQLQNSQSQFTNELNAARFELGDILLSESNGALTVHSNLLIYNLSTSTSGGNIHLNKLTVEFTTNQSKSLGTFIFNNFTGIKQITNSISGNILKIPISFDIEISPTLSNQDGFTVLLFSQLLAGQTLNIPFKGIIDFSIYGISQQINFNNILHITNKNTLQFKINRIETPTNSNNRTTLMSLMINNTLGISPTFVGDLQFIILNRLLGVSNKSLELFLSPNSHNYTLPITMVEKFNETVAFLINSSPQAIHVLINGTIKILGLPIPVLTSVRVNISTIDAFGFSISNFNITGLDQSTGNGNFTLNLSLRNDFLIDLNTSSVSMRFATIDDVIFGNLSWVATKPLFIGQSEVVSLYNISGYLIQATPFVLLKIKADKLINIPYLHLTLFTKTDSFPLTIALKSIPITI